MEFIYRKRFPSKCFLFERLPSQIQTKILLRMDGLSLLRLSRVNKRINKIVKNLPLSKRMEINMFVNIDKIMYKMEDPFSPKTYQWYVKEWMWNHLQNNSYLAEKVIWTTFVCQVFVFGYILTKKLGHLLEK